MTDGNIIYTVGHGRRDLSTFLDLLRFLELTVLIDIRSRPASRRHPHFSREPLAEACAEVGVRYVFEGADLGGYRKANPRSRHTALQQDGFRAYADHMSTPPFRRAATRVLERSRLDRVAVMCAEQFPIDCHRNLLADYLVAEGARVFHAIETDRLDEHRMSDQVRIVAGELIYDAGKGRQLDLGF